MSDGERLWEYAHRFNQRHERANQGTRWPTLGQCAKALGLRVQEVQDLAELGQFDNTGRRLDLLIAIGSRGAHVSLPRTQWTVEAYE